MVFGSGLIGAEVPGLGVADKIAHQCNIGLTNEGTFPLDGCGHKAGWVVEGGYDGASPFYILHSARENEPTGS